MLVTEELFRKPVMYKTMALVGVITALAVVNLACTPQVEVVAKEPININLNVKIEHEIRVKVDKDLDNVFDQKGLF